MIDSFSTFRKENKCPPVRAGHVITQRYSCLREGGCWKRLSFFCLVVSFFIFFFRRKITSRDRSRLHANEHVLQLLLIGTPKDRSSEIPFAASRGIYIYNLSLPCTSKYDMKNRAAAAVTRLHSCTYYDHHIIRWLPRVAVLNTYVPIARYLFPTVKLYDVTPTLPYALKFNEEVRLFRFSHGSAVVCACACVFLFLACFYFPQQHSYGRYCSLFYFSVVFVLLSLYSCSFPPFIRLAMI